MVCEGHGAQTNDWLILPEGKRHGEPESSEVGFTGCVGVFQRHHGDFPILPVPKSYSLVHLSISKLHLKKLSSSRCELSALRRWERFGKQSSSAMGFLAAGLLRAFTVFLAK